MTQLKEPLTAPISNSIFCIKPYWTGATWAFDAPEVGLYGEPFVSGADTILTDIAFRKLGVKPSVGASFIAIFSATGFPNYDMKLQRLHAEFGGYWYRDVDSGAEGWLCPATLKFFPNGHPETIFLKVEA